MRQGGGGGGARVRDKPGLGGGLAGWVGRWDGMGRWVGTLNSTLKQLKRVNVCAD